MLTIVIDGELLEGGLEKLGGALVNMSRMLG